MSECRYRTRTPKLLVVLREVLRHALGQRRDEHALAPGRDLANLAQQVVDLPGDRPHVDDRIDQSGRPDDLLDDDAAGLPQLVGTGRGAHEDDLPDACLPLLEVQRPVVERRRQPESVFDEHFLARPIAVVHPAHLRHGLMALVDDDHRVGRQVVEQRRRRLAGDAAGQVPRVVLDAVAVADLLDHLEIEHRPLVQPLRLELAARRLELGQPLGQLGLDRLDRLLRPRPRRDEVRLRIDGDAVVTANLAAGQRIEREQLVDLVAEQADAQPDVVVGRIDLDDVAAHAEGAALELVVVALVLNLDELPQNLVAIDLRAALERQHEAVVRLGRSEAVDARHARDDDDVAALEERPRRRQPQPVDLVVDDGFLLDVRVGRRHVGFGLVVVVVADEELDGVLRKEAPELLEELRGQRLVVHHDERRPVHARQHLRHREGLARAGDAEQHLRPVAAPQRLRSAARSPAAGRRAGRSRFRVGSDPAMEACTRALRAADTRGRKVTRACADLHALQVRPRHLHLHAPKLPSVAGFAGT